MKTNLKKILGLAALGMTLLATTVPTWAGRVSTSQSQHSKQPIASWASGNLVGARYSADTSNRSGVKLTLSVLIRGPRVLP